jgi:hypothetical protein
MSMSVRLGSITKRLSSWMERSLILASFRDVLRAFVPIRSEGLDLGLNRSDTCVVYGTMQLIHGVVRRVCMVHKATIVTKRPIHKRKNEKRHLAWSQDARPKMD